MSARLTDPLETSLPINYFAILLPLAHDVPSSLADQAHANRSLFAEAA